MDILLSLRIVSKGLGPSTKQCALPSLRSGWGIGKEGGANGKRGGSGNWDLVCKIKKDSLFSF